MRTKSVPEKSTSEAKSTSEVMSQHDESFLDIGPLLQGNAFAMGPAPETTTSDESTKTLEQRIQEAREKKQRLENEKKSRLLAQLEKDNQQLELDLLRSETVLLPEDPPSQYSFCGDCGLPKCKHPPTTIILGGMMCSDPSCKAVWCPHDDSVKKSQPPPARSGSLSHEMHRMAAGNGILASPTTGVSRMGPLTGLASLGFNPNNSTQQANRLTKDLASFQQQDNTPLGEFFNLLSKSKKIESGLTQKAHSVLVKQVRFPHHFTETNFRVPPKTWGDCEFYHYVSGEAELIRLTLDPIEKEGRLRLMTIMGSWVNRSRDWKIVRGVYSSILRAIELGQFTWGEDFRRFEFLLLDTESEKPDKLGAKQRKADPVFYCYAYQKGDCRKTTPHMGRVRGEEKLVHHVCASCLTKRREQVKHPDTDPQCPCRANSGSN